MQRQDTAVTVAMMDNTKISSLMLIKSTLNETMDNAIPQYFCSEKQIQNMPGPEWVNSQSKPKKRRSNSYHHYKWILAGLQHFLLNTHQPLRISYILPIFNITEFYHITKKTPREKATKAVVKVPHVKSYAAALKTNLEITETSLGAYSTIELEVLERQSRKDSVMESDRLPKAREIEPREPSPRRGILRFENSPRKVIRRHVHFKEEDTIPDGPAHCTQVEYFEKWLNDAYGFWYREVIMAVDWRRFLQEVKGYSEEEIDNEHSSWLSTDDGSSDEEDRGWDGYSRNWTFEDEEAYEHQQRKLWCRDNQTDFEAYYGIDKGSIEDIQDNEEDFDSNDEEEDGDEDEEDEEEDKYIEEYPMPYGIDIVFGHDSDDDNGDDDDDDDDDDDAADVDSEEHDYEEFSYSEHYEEEDDILAHDYENTL
jgi:hypothetical protein